MGNKVVSPPRFSVVMPSWNRGAAVRTAVSSVLRQSYRDFELIVVDDHSPTPVVEDLGELSTHPSLRCIRLDANSGVCAARNKGIELATGEYIAFLDDDDEFHPDKLAAVAQCLNEVAPDVVYHKMQIELVEERFSYVSNPYAGQFAYEDLLLKNLLGGPSMVVVRSEACISVGGFDETLPALEDYELWLRLAKAGFRFKFLDQVLSRYYRRANRAARSLSVANDIAAWDILHSRYHDDYQQLSRAKWREHLQKTDLYRAFRCLLGYRRLDTARHFVRSFRHRPSLGSSLLLGAAALSIISPRLCLVLQGRLKRMRFAQSLFFPDKQLEPAT